MPSEFDLANREHKKFTDTDGAKKVTVVDQSGNHVASATSAKQDEIIDAIESSVEIAYEYMGDKTSGNYKYLGFKQNGGANWKIMRKNNTDTSAWAYCYGTTGWTTAWSDPTALTFADPPNS